MFSLKSLLLSVVVAAVYIAAFVKRSEVWAGVSVTIALALLGYGLFSIYMFPERRAFFVPAVMIGVLFGSAGLIRPLGLNSSLVTTRLMFEWWYAGNRESAVESSPNQGNLDQVVIRTGSRDLDKEPTYSFIANELPDHYGFPDDFADWVVLHRIGHSACAVILAVGAGLAGSYVARRRDLKARPNH